MILTLVVALLSVLSVVSGSDWQCPAKCICVNDSMSSVITSLSVSCSASEQHPRNFTDEMNKLLANERAKHLRNLSITVSGLIEVPPSICQLSALQSLILDSNNIEQLPGGCFGRMSSLFVLSLRNNRIKHLQNGVFDGSSSLTSLNLQSNVIQSIGIRVFANESDLVNLQFIDISGNCLSELEPWPITRLMAVNGNGTVYVGMQQDESFSFTNNIGYHSKCRSNKHLKSLDIYACDFHYITQLLNGWGLTFTNLLCLANYRSVDSNPVKFRIAVHFAPFVCDCTDFDFYKFYSPLNSLSWHKANVFEGITCDRPSSLKDRNPFEIPLDQFVCDIRRAAGCPFDCLCVYQPSTASVVVKCFASSFTVLPTYLPSLPKWYTKYNIQISGNNRLVVLDYRDYFANTSHFELVNSTLRYVDGVDTWKYLFKAKSLMLQGNRLESLPHAVTSLQTIPQMLGLGNNNWSCLCEQWWMSVWLNSIKDHLSEPNDIRCGYPPRLHGRSILVAWEVEFCLDQVFDSIKIKLISSLTSVSGMLLVSVVIFISIYRVRFQLFVRYKIHPFDRDECAGELMHYDVFFSSSSEDVGVGESVVEKLEANGYKVCYHVRDFDAGDTIENNMGRAIERSKRTVCFVSANFIRRSVVRLS